MKGHHPGAVRSEHPTKDITIGMANTRDVPKVEKTKEKETDLTNDAIPVIVTHHGITREPRKGIFQETTGDKEEFHGGSESEREKCQGIAKITKCRPS